MVLLWLMIRRVPVQSIASAVEAAPVGLLLIAGAAAVTFNLIRALRYRVLLGSAQRVPIIQLAGVSTTAWAVSLALPSVFGDAAFVWLLRRTTRVGATKGAAAALVARVADVGSFVVIVPLATLVLGLRLPTAAVAAVAVIAAGVVALAVAMFRGGPRRALLDLVAKVRPLRPLTARGEEALAGLSDRGTLLNLAGTTLLARLCSAIGYMALFAALSSPLGFWQTTFAVSIRTLFLGLPIQGLAGLGTTQLWWTASLVMLGQPLSSALVTGLAVHVLDLAVSIPVAIGGVLLFLLTSKPSGSGRGALRRWAAPGWRVVPLGVFAVLRLPSFFEPHWYTDEAGYAATARAMMAGSRLYAEAWTNKPPLHILSVALPLWLFGPNEAALHTLTFLSGGAALLAVMFIGRRMLGTVGALVISTAFAIAIGLPFVDAQLAVPESLLIAPTTWAAAILFVRLQRTDRPSSWWASWGCAVTLGILTGLALGIQQTVLADAVAFFLAIAVSNRMSRRELLLFVVSAAVVVGAWLSVILAVAGPSKVTFSLVTFFFDYAAQSVPAPVGVLAIKALALLLVLVGVGYARRNSEPVWFFWLWACLTLGVSAVTNRAYPHFLTPAVAPTLLALATVPQMLPRLRLRFAPLGFAVGIAATFANVATLNTKALAAYVQWPAAISSGAWGAWTDQFDDRTHPDEDVAGWINGRGLAGSRAVVWSSDAWVYLLADLPVQLPAAPIYNDVVLLGSGDAVARRVAIIDPDIIVTSDDALYQWPEIRPLLDSDYMLAYTSAVNRVYMRRSNALRS